MSPTAPNPGPDKIHRLDPGRQFLFDIVSYTRRPDGCVITLILLDRARAFCHELRKKGVPMTLTPLIVRACALALRKHPWMNYMLRGRKVIEPAQIDIGIAIAAKGSITPVIVIPEADAKSLEELARELRDSSRAVRRVQDQTLELLRGIGWLIPIPFVRTWMARVFIRSQRARRRIHGTFQITGVAGPHVEIGMPFILGTTAILSYGSVAQRPVVVDGQVVARPCAYFAITGDHRFISGQQAWEFLADVKTLLEDPASLG